MLSQILYAVLLFKFLQMKALANTCTYIQLEYTINSIRTEINVKAEQMSEQTRTEQRKDCSKHHQNKPDN